MTSSKNESQRVSDIAEPGWADLEQFVRRYPRPFLVLVEVDTDDDEHEDFFTATRGEVEIKALLDIAEGRRLDANSHVFEIVKRLEANPYADLVTIGRASNCDIVIDFPGVSKFHSYLRRERTGQEQWVVGDGGSKNGTLLNGSMLMPKTTRPIQNGDRISLGAALTFRFLTPEGFYELMSR